MFVFVYWYDVIFYQVLKKNDLVLMLFFAVLRKPKKRAISYYARFSEQRGHILTCHSLPNKQNENSCVWVSPQLIIVY